VGGPLGANGVNDLQGETGAIMKAASVGIGALVGERREELMEQITVGGVNFDGVESSLAGSVRGLDKCFDDGCDAGLIESLGQSVVGRES